MDSYGNYMQNIYFNISRKLKILDLFQVCFLRKKKFLIYLKLVSFKKLQFYKLKSYKKYS